MELVEFLVNTLAGPRDFLTNGEDAEEKNSKSDAGNGGDFLGKQIDKGYPEKHEGNEGKSDGNFAPGNVQVQGNTVFARAGVFVTQHQDCQALHDETPDHTKGVSPAQDVEVPPTQDNRHELQANHEVDNPIGCAKPRMRAPKPVRQDTVLRHPVENPVGTYDGGVHRPGENHRTDQDDESMEHQTEREGPRDVHRQAADEIIEETLALGIRNDHHGEE